MAEEAVTEPDALDGLVGKMFEGRIAKAIEFYENGNIKRIEFCTMADLYPTPMRHPLDALAALGPLTAPPAPVEFPFVPIGEPWEPKTIS